jgi:DNA repair and recombination protein RAD54 and RAD54-like protein
MDEYDNENDTANIRIDEDDDEIMDEYTNKKYKTEENDENENNIPMSQVAINTSLLKRGDVEVEYGAVLPFLSVPVRKAALFRPFKLPGGAVRATTNTNDGISMPMKRLGARRRKPGTSSSVSFKRPICGHTLLLNVSTENNNLENNGESTEEEMEETSTSNVAEPIEYEPLILWSPPTTVEDTKDEIVDDATVKKLKPVSVDPVLCRFLREHQREGVQFMFDCVHGLKPFDGFGCILADDMGLGKTLQSITLLWTLLKQGINGVPTAKRVIVVCPTSLVANWAKEIIKWVGERVKVLALSEASRDKAIMDINTFLGGREYPVLIISYETFRMHASKFHARADSCDLLICDEAHRLKNDATLTAQALNGLACRRRILLSGTPMQNDLDEFWAMVDFTNPGVLGDAPTFRRKFVTPILTSREPWASAAQIADGEAATAELSRIVNQFILRRTNALLSKHLPPKLLQVVCVRPSPLQRQLYEHFLSSKELHLVMSGRQSGVLASITALRKLVNHPKLIYDAVRAKKQSTGGSRENEAKGFEDCEQYFPPNFARERGAFAEMSGKFDLASRMMTKLRNETDDRIVIVSCYTQTYVN